MYIIVFKPYLVVVHPLQLLSVPTSRKSSVSLLCPLFAVSGSVGFTDLNTASVFDFNKRMRSDADMPRDAELRAANHVLWELLKAIST